MPVVSKPSLRGARSEEPCPRPRLGGGGRDRPEAARPTVRSPAAGVAGGFNAVQKLLTTAGSRC
jgi:hypothetical protein